MLIAFLVFALIGVLLLFALLWYTYPSSRIVTSIPGIGPVNQISGNIPNIADDGGIPQFLLGLHNDHGMIVSFWLGDFLAISIKSLQLYRLVDIQCFNQESPYQTIVPLTLDSSVLEKSNEDSTFLNNLLSKFAPFRVSCVDKSRLKTEVKNLSAELCIVLANVGQCDHIAINDYMVALTVKIVIRTSELVTKSCDESKLRLAYCNLLQELGYFMSYEKNVGEKVREPLFARCNEFTKLVGKENSISVFGLILVISELSTWMLYYSSKIHELQKEIRETPSLIEAYFHEVLRITAFVPFTSCIVKQDLDLLGHHVEEGTLVINSLSSLCWDSKEFENPERVNLLRDMKSLTTVTNLMGTWNNKSYARLVAEAICETLISSFEMDLAFSGFQMAKSFTLVMKPECDVWLKLKKIL